MKAATQDSTESQTPTHILHSREPHYVSRRFRIVNAEYTTKLVGSKRSFDPFHFVTGKHEF